MELDLINRVSVAHEVSDASHRGRAEQPHDAPSPGRGQQRLVGVRVVAPGTGVEVLLRVGISVTLEQLDVIFLTNRKTPHHPDQSQASHD